MKFRRQKNVNFADYHNYKPFARRDFYYRCVYCHRHENAFGGYRGFQLDHIRPHTIKRFEHLKNSYSNLVYSCRDCNNIKRQCWPSDNPIIDGKGWLDPCENDFNEQYTIRFDGSQLVISTNTLLGEWLVQNLGFDQRARVQNISRWYRTIHKLKVTVRKLHWLSQGKDLSPDERKDALLHRDELLIELRGMFAPDEYTPFSIAK